MRTGLVLEGGGMRGIYVAGVLDVLMEEEIKADGVIGVSAGALHGCCYVSGQKGRSIRYYKKYVGDKRFMSFYSLFTTGDIVGKDFCYDEIPNRLDLFDYDTFERSPIDFYATCTNVETGNAEYVLCRDLHKDIDYMRASASLPGMSHIVEVGGMKLLDGGVADSIPVGAFRRLGYKKNIVVLTRPRDYRKRRSTLLVAKQMYNKYPEFIKAIAARYKKYNETLEQLKKLEARGEAIVIAPSRNLRVSRMEKNLDKIVQMYELGREDALAAVPEIREFLS